VNNSAHKKFTLGPREAAAISAALESGAQVSEGAAAEESLCRHPECAEKRAGTEGFGRAEGLYEHVRRVHDGDWLRSLDSKQLVTASSLTASSLACRKGSQLGELRTANREAEWETQLARLAAYDAAHGDCSVPHGWAEGPRLATWANKQRTGKRKLDRGDPSDGMTAARAAQLDALGFEWNPRRGLNMSKGSAQSCPQAPARPAVTPLAAMARDTGKKKMCEGCGLKAPGYGLASEGKRRWCAGCGAAEGAVSLKKQKMCEGCGLTRPGYGLASEGKARWCAGCGEAKGAVLIQALRNKQQNSKVVVVPVAKRYRAADEGEMCEPPTVAGVRGGEVLKARSAARPARPHDLADEAAEEEWTPPVRTRVAAAVRSRRRAAPRIPGASTFIYQNRESGRRLFF
jgi:hypothetical protein